MDVLEALKWNYRRGQDKRNGRKRNGRNGYAKI